MKPSSEVCGLGPVVERVARRQTRFPRGITNYFRQSLSATTFRVHETEQSLVFLFDDDHFVRLYFFTADLGDLKSRLADYCSDRATVMSWVERAESAEFRACLEGTGFCYYDHYRRMNCRPLPTYPLAGEPGFAWESEAAELRQRMTRDFDAYTAHLPTVAELRDFAANHWIIVRRHQGRITGYIVFRPHGSHMFFNYLFNDSSFPQDALLLFREFFGVLGRLGVTSGHLWVKHDNRRVIQLYRAFGWTFDGLTTHYYVKPPTKS